MPTASTASLSLLVKIYYDRRMLERLTPQLMFHQFGVKKELPKHEGNVIYWHRWNLFTKGRLIAESHAGATRGISATRVSSTLIMIGDHAAITSYVDMVSINSVVQGAIDLFADSAALTLDFMTGRLLLWKKTSISCTLGVSAAAACLQTANTLSAAAGAAITCQSISSTGWQAPLWDIDYLDSRTGSSGARLSAVHGYSTKQKVTSGGSLSPGKIRNLALKLRVKNALPFEDGYFKAIIHPDIVHQLRGTSAFTDLHKYTETGAATFEKGTLRQAGERGLVGVMEGFKFYESTEAPKCNTSNYAVADLSPSTTRWGGGRFYFSFFFGKNSYGVTDFDGGVNTFVKTPGPNTTNDPLSLYSTVGYRIISTAKVLNPSACLWVVQGRPSVTG